MDEQVEINHFSILCRLFGNFFQRQPQDPILAPALQWLQQGGVKTIWDLAADPQTDTALTQLTSGWTLEQLSQDYQHLQQSVDFKLSAYGVDVEQFKAFRQERAMPEVADSDHIALPLLTAAWIEDQMGSLEAQRQLFQTFLLPTIGRFLGQIEAHAQTAFYRSLAQLCRDLLAAMADEIEEEEQ